jgi:hypothetical protein
MAALATVRFEEWLQPNCPGESIGRSTLTATSCSQGEEGWPFQSVRATTATPCPAGQSAHVKISSADCSNFAVNLEIPADGKCYGIDFIPWAQTVYCK